MKHQYQTDVFWKKGLQQFVDFFIDFYAKFFIDKSLDTQPVEPKNILIVSLGHLGDTLIDSFVFPLIHERFPNVQIDVLTGEWCKPVLENNPYVRKLIFFNHFRINRSEISLWEKIRIHIKSSHSALDTIRSQKYDITIEGRVSHPNGNLLTYRGKIKRRIGFGSGGFGSLLTDEILVPAQAHFHILDALLEELKKIGIEKKLAEIKPYFAVSKQRTLKGHPFANYFNDSFIIVHAESGNVNRMFSNEFWLEVVKIILDEKKYKIIICGTSSKSIDLIDFLSANLPNAKEQIINAVQKLSIDEFFLLAEHARAAITLESLPAHLCAITCNTLSFYKNGPGILFFPIPNKKVTVINNHLPSRNIDIHTGIKNYYVKKFESKETYLLVTDLINSLASEKIQV